MASVTDGGPAAARAADGQPAPMGRLVDATVVAVVGVSGTVGGPGRTAYDALRTNPSVTVFPVNGRQAEIDGNPCYATLADLPADPEAVVVAVPAALVPGVIEDAVARGCHSFVVLSSTMGVTDERTGRSVDDALLELHREHGLSLLGPASGGMIDFASRRFLSFSTLLDGSRPFVDGGLALVSQSGGVATYTGALGLTRGIGFSWVAVTGTELVMDTLDVAEQLGRRDEVRVVCLYLENLADGARFRRVAESIAAQGKALVVMWAGRHAKAQRAALSHSGALAVDAKVIEGLCAQTGAILTHTPEQLLAAATFAERGVRSNRLAIVTASGGFSVILGDLAQELDLDLADLSSATVDRLNGLLPFNASAQNPVDTGAIDPRTVSLPAVLEAVGADEHVDTVVFFTGLGGTGAMRLAEELAGSAPADVVLAVIWLAAPAEALRVLQAAGILVFESTQECLEGLSLASHRAAPDAAGRSDRSAPALPDGVLSTVSGTVREDRAKQVLSSWGIPVPDGAFSETPEGLAEQAARLRPPFALKGMHDRLVHKFREGAVRLNVASGAEAVADATAMRHALRGRYDLDGFLLEEMAGTDLEVFLGVTIDDRFGALLTFGTGGVHTEVHNDVEVRALPVSRATIGAMIERSTVGRILRSPTAGPHAEAIRERLTSIVQTVADLAPGLPDVAACDVNPVQISFATGSVVAVDGSIELQHPTASRQETA
jgi:acyl-CoA synthetase (NDP forming)